MTSRYAGDETIGLGLIFFENRLKKLGGCCCNTAAAGSIILKYMGHGTCVTFIMYRVLLFYLVCSNIVSCNKIPMAPPLQIKMTSKQWKLLEEPTTTVWSVQNDSWAYANHHPNYQRAHFLP